MLTTTKMAFAITMKTVEGNAHTKAKVGETVLAFVMARDV
jgi:hypothetical protein